jgi:uncharacterized RDD family membrane protein YckC
MFAGDEERSTLPEPASSSAPGQTPLAEMAWRQEVASRVQQHRARRRQPADPNSLELDFPSHSPHSFTGPSYHSPMPPPDRFAEIIVESNMVQRNPARQEPPKVIRFPRPQPAYVPTVEEITLDELELYEPAPEAPRIMEAAEPEPVPVSQYQPAAFQGQQMDLLPSFADIRLEPEEARSGDDLEVIPLPAPFGQRFVSGLVDAALVFIATGIFALTFIELAEEMPRSRMTLLCLLAAGGIFWLLFQYIFLTYRRATPGMRMAQLELCTFEGTATSMLERQRRALASALSGFSMGLGYAWALVDEDRLGWHDRISRTHLRPSCAMPSCVIPGRAKEAHYYDDLKG